MAHSCHPSKGRRHKIGGAQSRPIWTKKKKDPISKTTRAKRVGGMAQVVAA
jgi:hypothetical protein